MQRKDGVADLLKRLRVKNKIKQHHRRDKRYQKIYNKHEDIRKATVEKIESGKITNEDQLESVNKKLARMRETMERISKKDLISAAKTDELLTKLEK